MPGLQIHALEFGADYDEEGHVWADRPRDVQDALIAGGGYMTLLGDAFLETTFDWRKSTHFPATLVIATGSSV